MTNNIGVLGCGWLGFPLAKKLVQSDYIVHGTTTSQTKIDVLSESGIIPYQISLNETQIVGDIAHFLSQLDILIVNVPPRLRGAGQKENYVSKIQLLSKAVAKHGPSKLLFVSSTSVYGDVTGEVTEQTAPNPTTESGKQLLQSEDLIQSLEGLQTSIIRFGGLIGPNRNPVTMLSGRQGLKNGNDFINLIHLEDCIHMIITILSRNYWGEVFNGVYPDHPTKKEFYTRQAEKMGIPAPYYLPSETVHSSKRVISKNFLDKHHKFNTPISE